ncbi:hypothetical protein LOZ58_000215 [Ophidiomyces ophidiicola]|nr:hypothetical protein LOZ66_003805 [Ophidiomyces ophidiicola]KAI1966727.1 hypothetical protein LOZ58_000215 [Ophidiomyces ophidiicola]
MADNEARVYGDLLVTMTTRYAWRWDDSGSGGSTPGAFWHPVAQAAGALKPLGSVVFRAYADPSGTRASLLVGQATSSASASAPPAVAAPTGYARLWVNENSGARRTGSLWRPVAPAGYVAVGDVAHSAWDAPSTDLVWCLRADLVSAAAAFVEPAAWDSRGSGARDEVAVWRVEPHATSAVGGPLLPILADTFRAATGLAKPPAATAAAAAGAALVPLLAVEKHFDPFRTPLPDLDPRRLPAPGDVFSKIEQTVIALPFVAFRDPTDRDSVDNADRPFCLICMATAWYNTATHRNDSLANLPRLDRTPVGVPSELSDRLTRSTGASVSAAAGLAARFATSLNYQFTSDQPPRPAYPEFAAGLRALDFVVPPLSAAAVFVHHIWFRVTHADENWIIGEIDFHANNPLNFRLVSLVPAAAVDAAATETEDKETETVAAAAAVAGSMEELKV